MCKLYFCWSTDPNSRIRENEIRKQLVIYLATSMGQLDTNLAALRMDKVNGPLEAWDVVIGPETRTARSNTAVGQDSSGLGNDQTRAIKGICSQVDQVKVGEKAIFGRVHAHGSDNDAVGQGQVFDGEGLEQQGDLVCIGKRGVDGAQVRSNGVGLLVVVLGLGELGLGLDDGLDGFVTGVVLEGGHLGGNLVGVLVVVGTVVGRVIARKDVDVDVDMEAVAVLSC